MDFLKKFKITSKKNQSLLCIGLDPVVDLMPKGSSIFSFNKKIIDSTYNLVACYKPNIAFYESQGIEGLKELKKTILYLKKNHLDIPIIIDAKRADIPNTASHYAKAMFDFWDADATTVYPNLGYDCVEPFLKYKNKLTILLLKTSNRDSSAMQNTKIGKQPYYQIVANEIKKWTQKNIGIFIGATYPKDMNRVRQMFPDKFFLSAGVGAQGGNLKAIVLAGLDKNKSNIVFNSSRGIIFSTNPKAEAEKIKNQINLNR